MTNSNVHIENGVGIALAWPETLCKRPGSWYDSIAHLLGISKNHYYKVGHAAVVIIDKATGVVEYFDFGRYHSPFQHGRVRSAVTDHDFQVKTKATFNNEGELENLNAILKELGANKSCHGDGKLYATHTNIDYQKSMDKILELQQNSPLLYGPFVLKGTNCSRFVNTAIYAGTNSWVKKLLLKLTLSPTPMWNIKALKFGKSWKQQNNNSKIKLGLQ